ncbi:VanZ family protein [Acetivibrio cellulolyticus]|uniref:VanZ family protein n=1 Tax=Acetivibrio cellulolyticus TaxID=35830 RepID=UPI0001E2F5F9|nr:VanZ family protein [Acetivibrio cellulolyticus]
MNKKFSFVLVTIIGILYLIYTPLQSGFVMHFGELDFRLGLLDICISLTNKLHIIGFGIMAIFMLKALDGKPKKYLLTFVSIISFSIIIEITQIFFTEGHFRLRDLISNSAGILISFGLYRLIYERFKSLKGIKHALINLVLVIFQIGIALIIYYTFKEISVYIGGENLRKYL